MPRFALSATAVLVLLAAPALAQQQGAPSELQNGPVPGTSGITAVPDTRTVTDSGKDRGHVNHPDTIPPGSAGAEKPFATGPLQGGGGPAGPASSTPGPRSDAAPTQPLRLAQAQQETTQLQPPSAAPGTQSATPVPRAAQVDARVQRELQDLYTRLRITPAQQPQWNAFASTMQANAQRMAQLWSARQSGGASALDDMRGYAQIAQAHAEDMQRLVNAFTPLYDSLSPEQKAAADQAFRDAARRYGRRVPR